MLDEIFDFMYTTDMYPEKLKPLERKDLCKGMSEADVDIYLSLVKQLYEALYFEVSADYKPLPKEELRERHYNQTRIYNSLIKHLFKCDAISDETYVALHEYLAAEFSFESIPGNDEQYVSDSLDDFRLSFERCIVDSNPSVDVSDEYLIDRYGYGWCVRPGTKKLYVVPSDLFIYSCADANSLPFREISYWEAKALLKRIREDIKKNADEQSRVDTAITKVFSNKAVFSPPQKWTYKEPKTYAEWYTIKKALLNEEDKLSSVELEVQEIFDGMTKPSEMVGTGATLYIYKGKTACHVHNHAIVAATAILFDTNDSEIEMDVEYCPKCDKYLLNFISFERYREKYSVLIGKLRMVSSTAVSGEFELAAESPLKLCGYNVSETEGLSTSTRQFILSKIIHEGIMKKTEVIHYLEHFINMNGAKKENVLAAQKWRDDLDFVHSYNIDIQPKTFITYVKKY